MAHGLARKEDVMTSLLQMMRQSTEKKPQSKGIQKKKPRDLEPLVLEAPAEDMKLVLEIRGDGQTNVDWVSVHVKLKTWESTVATAQNLLQEWWRRGVDHGVV